MGNKSEIARDILAHLFKHPDAQDTLEGIVQWWLIERKIKYQNSIIEEALNQLLKNGLIHEFGKVDSQIYYRINGSNVIKIKKYLNKRQIKPDS